MLKKDGSQLPNSLGQPQFPTKLGPKKRIAAWPSRKYPKPRRLVMYIPAVVDQTEPNWHWSISISRLRNDIS
jgi:hypothetical protein